MKKFHQLIDNIIIVFINNINIINLIKLLILLLILININIIVIVFIMNTLKCRPQDCAARGGPSSCATVNVCICYGKVIKLSSFDRLQFFFNFV